MTKYQTAFAQLEFMMESSNRMIGCLSIIVIASQLDQQTLSIDSHMNWISLLRSTPCFEGKKRIFSCKILKLVECNLSVFN